MSAQVNRRKRINPINRKRRKRQWQRTFGEKAAWIRQLNCVACSRVPSEAAHMKSRGAGGTSEHLVPLCTACHATQHSVGIKTFQQMHDIDLATAARRYEKRWQAVQAGGDDYGF